jgi:uncharacterized damage-inducible protein DinB
MAISSREVLIAEFDRETAATRRVLARVPDDRLNWRPHARSRSLGELAGHLSALPGWVTRIAQTTSFDLGPVLPVTVAPSSMLAALRTYDENVAGARAALVGQSEAEMAVRWTLLRQGRPLLALPRLMAIRSQLLGHLIHHRGQLTVYLRLLDVPVPPVYGPSADEGAL